MQSDITVIIAGNIDTTETVAAKQIILVL